MTDRTPYTYFIGWSHLNTHYYGVRFGVGCHPNEFWKTYFTSSKHVKEFVIQNGDPDIIEIRKVFDDVTKARMWEHRVLKRLDAANRGEFLNKSDGLSIPPLCGDDNPAKRPEVREKIATTIITSYENGYVHPFKANPEKYADSIAERGLRRRGKSNHWSLGEKNPMHRPDVKKKHADALASRPNPNKGKPLSVEHIEKIRLGNIGVKRQKHECVHCGGMFAMNTLLRWHGDNCKHNKGE